MTSTEELRKQREDEFKQLVVVLNLAKRQANATGKPMAVGCYLANGVKFYTWDHLHVVHVKSWVQIKIIEPEVPIP